MSVNRILPASLSPRRRTRHGRRRIPSLLGLLPLALGLLIWQLVQTGQSAYFPRPSLWVGAIVDLWNRGVLMPAFWATVSSFVVSFVIASFFGAVIGMLVGRSPLANKLTGPVFEFCRALPAAAVVPMAVLFGGYTANMKVAVVVFAAIWPVLLTVQAGARGLQSARLDLGRSMRLSKWQSLTKILIPSMVPAILLGVRVAAPIVLIIVLLVEIITQVPGLGGLLALAQQSYRAAEVYGIVAIASLLGLLTNVLVSAIEAVALRYEPE